MGAQYAMVDPPNLARLKLSAAKAQQQVRALAKDSCNVQVSHHARDRMVERGISTADLYRILREGFVEEAPTLTERQEWKCKMVRTMSGGRVAGAVVLVLRARKLFLKTVEWEDGR